ncbi:hypothetical protein SOCE26_018450 [Sorangium cellulosum]|uniref:Transcriptional initiation protein Tat n=1 Tax=Sorangium cellulosum TaxID=56 RepID=A0A2L0EMB8_SORCE|nr:hypothetical protein SOCE26_018450 [Sorangium cellulosum]
MKSAQSKIGRRQLLQWGVAAGGALGVSSLLSSRGRAAGIPPRYLLVIGAHGGASIVDSMLAVRHSESAHWETINTFPDSEVKGFDGSPLRAVDIERPTAGPFPSPLRAKQSSFVQAHREQMLVATLTGSSVNHFVGQRRSITGNEAWRGRTLQECVAKEYGDDFSIPNINMTSGGFADRGHDETLPSRCFSELIAEPSTWSLGLDARKGIKAAPPSALLDEARRLRDERIEPQSPFLQAFGQAEPLRLWAEQRAKARTNLEARGLLEKLCLLQDSKDYPLSDYNVESSPEAAMLREAFPLLDADPLEAQAALAYLLFKNQVCVTATIWPTTRILIEKGSNTLVNAPVAFDYSHNYHRSMQAVMWSRILKVTDALIGLLKQTPADDSGASLWDRTLIYVATEFGRTRARVGGQDDFGSSHDLNNGVLLVSPMLKGNRVLGGVDPDTGLTYGFDPTTGAPDKGRQTSEAEIFSGILDVMRVDTSGSGLPAVTALRG